MRDESENQFNPHDILDMALVANISTMKYSIIILGLLVIACSDGKNKTEDSMTVETKMDTVLLVDKEGTNQATEHVTMQQEDFEKFFEKFCTDSMFQKSRVRFPFPEISYDIEDNKTINSLTSVDWTSINLKYDSSAYYKKVDSYKQIFEIESDRAKVGFRGIDNGIYFDFIFEIPDSTWQLVRYVDYSN